MLVILRLFIEVCGERQYTTSIAIPRSHQVVSQLLKISYSAELHIKLTQLLLVRNIWLLYSKKPFHSLENVCASCFSSVLWMSCHLSKHEERGYEDREWLWMYFQLWCRDRQLPFSRSGLCIWLDRMWLFHFLIRRIKPTQVCAVPCGLPGKLGVSAQCSMWTHFKCLGWGAVWLEGLGSPP